MVTPITLKQLSYLSGFSISTVSKALNDSYEISSKTRKFIKLIAKENNYTPNSYAVALRKKKTNNIAVILPHVNDEFYSCFLFNIEKVASSFGYRITFFQSFEEESKIKESILKTNNGSVDGIILLSELNKISDNTIEINNLPMEKIKISKNKTLKELKTECIAGFTKLIDLINKK